MGYPYATLQSFYDFLKAEAIVCSARRVTGVDSATNRFRVPGHGFTTGDAIRFELGEAAYGGTASLPSPLSEFVVYYVTIASSDLFTVSLTDGGAAVDITTAGVGLLSCILDLSASITRHLTRNASRVDKCLLAQGVELPLVGDFPDIDSLVCRLTAWPVLLARGYTSGRQVDPDQDYKVLWTDAEEELSDLCSGDGPLPSGVEASSAASLAEAHDENARGWTPDGDGGI